MDSGTDTRLRPAPRRRPRGLRDHRGPGKGDDVPVVVPAGGPGAAGLPRRGRRRRRLECRPARRARPRVDRGHGRGDRPRGVRPVHREVVVRARRLHRPRHVPAGRRRDQGRRVPGVLPRDPALPLREGGARPRRGGPDRLGSRGRGEAVRARPGVCRSARRRAAPVHRRVAAVPHRPLPREDGDRRDPAPALREHHPRAGLEPQLRLARADQHVRGLRCRGPRPLLRPGRRDARRRGQPPDAGRVGGGDGGALAR